MAAAELRADPGFGRSFTDHMALARFTRAGGWAVPDIVPFEPLSLSPAAMVFHYGQAVFEGLKAFRQDDGGVALFRLADHANRFRQSAARLVMPPLDRDLFEAACLGLVEVDHEAVPDADGQSLYLRPTMIATEAALGVRPADEYLFAVIASPVGSYFSSGVRPITVWATPDYVRAAPGGTGAAKCGGNYAAGLAAKDQAVANGCDEVLWLDAVERRWLEELGGMNVVLVDGDIVVAPAPHDTILDGITRRSVLTMAAHLGLGVEERPVSIDELMAGRYSEAFACGTAAVIAPIGQVRSAQTHCVVGDGSVGPVTSALRAALIAAQRGGTDPFRWLTPVQSAKLAAC
jgi:branched-chain amino acid aminotransferase